MPLNQIYSNERTSHYLSEFPSQPLPSEKPDFASTISQSSQTQSLNGEMGSLFGSRELSDLGWENFPSLAPTGEPIPISSHRTPHLSPHHLRKSLLKLEMELLEDWDLLETGSMSPQSSSFLHHSSNLPIETLDLPIHRLLNHSSWLLEIIQSLCCSTGQASNLISSPLSEAQSDKVEDPLSLFQDVVDVDEGVTTISPHDSGYRTATTSPARITTPLVFKCEIAIWLGIMEAHCTLVRIYRAVFTRLYQLFLIIPPTDAATILSLPNIRFGQFHLDGSLLIQVQSLIEWSSTMMAEIDRALAACSNSDDSELVYEQHWSTLIRDIVLTQEHEPCEMPLTDLMHCLRQIISSPSNI